MKYTKSKKRTKLKAIKRAKELMDSRMPKNTNFTANAARQRISEIIIDMIFNEFSVEEKSKGLLKRLRKRL